MFDRSQVADEQRIILELIKELYAKVNQDQIIRLNPLGQNFITRSVSKDFGIQLQG